MPNSQKAALLIAGFMTLIAFYLVLNRGGLLAWAMTIVGAALLLKFWLKPASTDAVSGAATASIGALLWAGTFYYVIATWESGEVVELTINTANGTHTARVWALEIDGSVVIYYDAPPNAAEALLSGNPLQLRSGSDVSTRIPLAEKIDALPEHRAERVLDAMVSKYGDRVGAADVFYLLLGRPKDRVGVVAELNEV